VIDEHFLPLGIDAEDLPAHFVPLRLRRAAAPGRRQGGEDRDSSESAHMVNSTK